MLPEAPMGHCCGGLRGPPEAALGAAPLHPETELFTDPAIAGLTSVEQTVAASSSPPTYRCPAPGGTLDFRCNFVEGGSIWVRVRPEEPVQSIRNLVADYLGKKTCQVMLRAGEEVLASNKLASDVVHPDVQVVLASPVQVATCSDDRSLRIFHLVAGEAVNTEHVGCGDAHRTISWDPTGSKLLSGSPDGAARIFDCVTKKQLAAFDHMLPVLSVDWSPDSSMVATGCADFSARVFDASMKELRFRFDHTLAVHVVAFSPDGSKLATGTGGDEARIYDLKNGIELGRFRHPSPVCSLSWHPQGVQVATACSDCYVRIFHLLGPQDVDVLPVPTIVNCVAWNPSQWDLIATSSCDAVRVFKINTWSENLCLPSRATVNGIAWDPDGFNVATACNDGFAYIYDGVTGDKGAVLKHDRFVHMVKFCPANKIMGTDALDRIADLKGWSKIIDDVR